MACAFFRESSKESLLENTRWMARLSGKRGDDGGVAEGHRKRHAVVEENGLPLPVTLSEM